MTFRDWLAAGFLPDKAMLVNISYSIGRRMVWKVKNYIAIFPFVAATFPPKMFFTFGKSPMSFRMQFNSAFDCFRPSSTRQFTVLKYLGDYSSATTRCITKMNSDLLESKSLLPMQTQQFIARDFVLYRYSIWHILIILLYVPSVKCSLC